MANWKIKIDVSEFFHKYDDVKYNPEHFKEIKKGIITILRKHNKEIKDKYGNISFEVYKNIVDNISKCRTLKSFNQKWDMLYNWADMNLVWIST